MEVILIKVHGYGRGLNLNSLNLGACYIVKDMNKIRIGLDPWIPTCAHSKSKLLATVTYPMHLNMDLWIRNTKT